MRRLSLSKSLVITIAILILFPCSADALSQDQINIYNSGVYYFDSATASGTGGCELGSGTLPATIPEPANGIFTAAANKFSIPPALVGAIYFVENNGKQGTDPSVYKWRDPPPPYGQGSPFSAVSSAGAKGPFQFLDGTWASQQQDGNGDGIKDVTDLADAAFGAAHYLKGLLDAANGNIEMAAGGYEAGHPVDSEYGQDAYALYQFFSSGGTVASSTNQIQSGEGVCGTTNLGSVNIKQVNAFGTADGPMGHQPTMIGLHYTAGHEQTYQDAVSSLKSNAVAKDCNPSGCSVQLTVDPSGNVYQLTSRLDVITENIINFNDADIGIEIMGTDEQSLLNDKAQFNAVVALVSQLMQKYNIKMEQNFSQKSGLMGHMECDAWSDAHAGQQFSGQYAGYVIKRTQDHQDPGSVYISQVRAALGGSG